MLGLDIRDAKTSITGVGNVSSNNVLGKVDCFISPSNKGYKSVKSEALVMNAITGPTPSCQVNPDVIFRFNNYKLADKNWYQPGEIDFLLGATIYYDILVNRPFIRGKPNGIHTIFGLVIAGNIDDNHENNVYKCMLGVHSALDVAVTKFWQSEEVNDANVENPDDVFCENYFKETTKRTPEGRYVVRLPFNSPPVSCGTNRIEAERRFMSLERRLDRDQKLKLDYNSFLSEYEFLGHMKVAKETANYIIPHHPVFKSSSSTTKVRVVFDGSAKDSMNMSLNDRMYKGPNLTRNVSLMLSGFRLFAVALTADLKMMYRQVLVAPEDCIQQHILWRDPKDFSVKEYELCTVTYGLASSSFLAQRALQQLVIDEGGEFSLASDIIRNQSYVDDVCGGADTEEEALRLYHELIDLLGRGGFFPRKWSSSSCKVLQNIPDEHRETPLSIREEGDLTVRVLGLEWNSSKDSFMYCIGQFDGVVTKRNVLSYVAKIFDPLGLLTPFVFWIKYFLQQMWLQGLGWDDPLTNVMSSEWGNFISNVDMLSNVLVPRYIPALKSQDLMIVGFCDGSIKGYGAVIYVRCMYEGNVKVSLLCGKSKVAPLKVLSIPRLELEAAFLLVKMLSSMKEFLSRLPMYQLILYSDSNVVLSWLRTPPYKLKTYVANRVVAINDIVAPAVWRHVPTEMNAADCASRGLTAPELLKHELWWRGPPFLLNSVSDWPCDDGYQYVENEILPETKISNICNVKSENIPNYLCDVMCKFSTYGKLRRVFAYVNRFIYNCKGGVNNRRSGMLSASEITTAEDLIIMLVQGREFCKEIEMIKQNKGHLTPLKALTPFIDVQGFVRVGGRLAHSSLSYSKKHPILIPGKSHLAKLICEYYHYVLLHAGPLAMRAQIQLKFWIPGIGVLLRSVIFKCNKCYRFKCKPSVPIMSDLPPSRFSQLRPFIHVGCDFAGPVILKESRRPKARTHKAWFCVFVCFATKAIHLEIVSDLTTDAYIAALERFIGRRGLCIRIQTDCGTNFVGAARQLKEMYNFLKESCDVITERLSEKKIEWVFNPPAAPHFGGIHEAAVKSMKYHLNRVVGDHIFTFEELATLLCRVEAVCNSRPLCGVVAKTPQDDLEYLSPGHFLIGSTMLSLPEGNILDVAVNRLNRWQLIQQNVQRFWKVWSSAYLQTLIPRKKWNKPNVPLAIGDVVLIKGMALSPLNWPIGRIVDLREGSDGIVRVAGLKVGNGHLVRPITSLIKFPFEQ